MKARRTHKNEENNVKAYANDIIEIHQLANPTCQYKIEWFSAKRGTYNKSAWRIYELDETGKWESFGEVWTIEDEGAVVELVGDLYEGGATAEELDEIRGY